MLLLLMPSVLIMHVVILITVMKVVNYSLPITATLFNKAANLIFCP